MRASFQLTQHWLLVLAIAFWIPNILAFLQLILVPFCHNAMSRAALFVQHSFTMVHFYTLWLSKWGFLCSIFKVVIQDTALCVYRDLFCMEPFIKSTYFALIHTKFKNKS